MPGIFLGSNLLKKGVSWRGFKGSLIFALGFHTHDVLFPNPKRVFKEINQSLAEAESVEEEWRTQLAELIETKKVFDNLMQLYIARTAELEELKKANGLWNRVENRRKNLSGVSCEGIDQKK